MNRCRIRNRRWRDAGGWLSNEVHMGDLPLLHLKVRLRQNEHSRQDTEPAEPTRTREADLKQGRRLPGRRWPQRLKLVKSHLFK